MPLPHAESLTTAAAVPDVDERFRAFFDNAASERCRRQRSALVALGSRNVLGTDDLVSAFRLITETIAKALDVERVSIWRYTVDRSAIQCVDLYELAADRHSSGTELTAVAFPSYFSSICESDAIAVNDARHDPRTHELLTSYLLPADITSMLDASVRVGGDVYGVLCHEHVGTLREWASDEKTFAVAMASYVSHAVEAWTRRQAQASLKASEERFRQIMETAQEGIWTIDASNKTTFVNPKGASLLGYTTGEMMGAELFDFMDDDGRTIARASLEQHRGRGEELEFRFRKKDGTFVWTTVNWAPLLDEAGQYMGALAMVADISGRKEKEETLRLQSAALNAAADAMVITDRDGTIEWINPAFTSLTGYSADEAVGKNPRELIRSGVHDKTFYKELWDTILAGRVWRGEITNRRKDGSRYTEEQSVTPVKDTHGDIKHFIAIKHDLTEEKRLQTQFLQAQKMEIVGRLAGGIAHDFNNLLTVINGTAEFGFMALKEGDPLREDFRQIQQAGARAAAMTRQLLAFSRKQVMKLDVLNLNPVVAEMQGMLQRLIGEDIDLVVVPANDAGSVRVDAGQMEQVILNLAVNARDAMPRGGRLTIETRNVELDEAYAAMHASIRAGQYVMLAVSDTGIGMDAATQARIFEPFFTTKGPTKGTGLGLSTVYGIVKQSGGSIWVYSEPGCGTTFKIYLPRVSDAVQVNRPAPVCAAQPGTETILLVEDEEALRNLGIRILRSAGYTVLAAGSGEIALQMLQRHAGEVHLIFTDMVMPGMGGRDLAAQVKEAHPDIKVLYTSGYTDDTVLRDGVLDNLAHFIGKPYTRSALTNAVRKALDDRSGA